MDGVQTGAPRAAATDDVRPAHVPATAGATSTPSSGAHVAPARGRWRVFRIVVGVVLGLGPLVGLHIHLRARDRADELYAPRRTAAIGARSHAVRDRIGRVEQDLVACAEFVCASPEPESAFDAAMTALLSRHHLLTSITWVTALHPDGGGRTRRAAPADASPPGGPARADASAVRDAMRAAVRTQRTALARFVRGPAADAGATATLVTPFEAPPPGGSTDLFVAEVHVGAWLAEAATDADDPDHRELGVTRHETTDPAVGPSTDADGTRSDHPLQIAGRVLVRRAAPTAAFEAARRPATTATVPVLAALAWEAVAAALLGPRPPDGDARGWLARAPVTGPEGATVRRTPGDVLDRALAGETVPERDWKFADDSGGRWLAISARPLRQDGTSATGAVSAATRR